MNKEEAIALLEAELAQFRAASYTQLVARMAAGPIHVERIARSRIKYQVEIQVCWDNPPDGNIRVMGSIDDGGWRAFVPFNRDFIKAPDGTFVGEWIAFVLPAATRSDKRLQPAARASRSVVRRGNAAGVGPIE
jgi:hypothetical protein